MKFTKTFVVVLLSFPLLTAPAFADRDRGGWNQRAAPAQARSQAPQRSSAPRMSESGRKIHDMYRAPIETQRAPRQQAAPPQRQYTQPQPRVAQPARPAARPTAQQPPQLRVPERQPQPFRVAERQSSQQPRTSESGRKIYDMYRPAIEAQKAQRSGASQHDNGRGHGGNGWHGDNNGHGGNDWRGGHGGHNNYWHGDIHHFRHYDYPYWRRGYWNRGWYGNRFGWWWVVGPSWYGYSAPVYPYPNPYIPPVVLRETVVVENQAEETDYWYYCEDPEGYYPYVKECAEEWFRVPAEPEPPPSPYTETP